MKPEVLTVIATFFTTLAQVSFKLGSQSEFQIGIFPLSPYIILGLGAYSLSALLFVKALKFGELSTLYPIWALSFIWILTASSLFLNEYVSLTNWAGVIFIIGGVALVGRGNK